MLHAYKALQPNSSSWNIQISYAARNSPFVLLHLYIYIYTFDICIPCKHIIHSPRLLPMNTGGVHCRQRFASCAFAFSRNYSVIIPGRWPGSLGSLDIFRDSYCNFSSNHMSHVLMDIASQFNNDCSFPT